MENKIRSGGKRTEIVACEACKMTGINMYYIDEKDIEAETKGEGWHQEPCQRCKGHGRLLRTCETEYYELTFANKVKFRKNNRH